MVKERLIGKITRTALIYLGGVVCVMLILFAVGVAHIRASDGNAYGIVAVGNRGLPSYYNPLINLLLASELLGLFVVAFGAVIAKKQFRIPPFPWILATTVTTLFYLLSSMSLRTQLTDPEVVSFWPDFWRFQICLFAGFMTAYLSIFYFGAFTRLKKTIHK